MAAGTSHLDALAGQGPSQTYFAFISYRHTDNIEEHRQWAIWLHHQLETYDVPAELLGTRNLRGELVPPRIYPVFRDEASLPADADLSAAIRKALDQSHWLIVLCSPHAVQSRYVADEILHFKASGKADRVIAALLLGTPNGSADTATGDGPTDVRLLECFPEPLKYAVDESGRLQRDKPTQPIAADFRLPDGRQGITNPHVFKRRLLDEGATRKRADRLAAAYEEQMPPPQNLWVGNQ